MDHPKPKFLSGPRALLGIVMIAALLVVGCSSDRDGNNPSPPNAVTPTQAATTALGGSGFQGPLVGKVNKVLFDPASPNVSYAATEFSIFKSEDSQQTWHWVTNVDGPLTPNPIQPSIIYQETKTGLLRTSDGGVTWSRDYSGLSHLNRLVPIPGSPEGLYAETWDGLFKSADGGRSWTPSNSGLPTGNIVISFDPTGNNHAFAIAGLSLFESRDAGGTWSLVKKFEGEFSSHDVIKSFAIDPTDARKMFVGLSGFLNFSSVQKTSDGGKSWKKIYTNCSAFNYGIDYLAVDPRNPNIVYVEVGGYFCKSVDAGESFTSISGSASNHLFDPNNQSVLVASAMNPFASIYSANGGVYRSADGGITWKNTSIGFIPTPSGTVKFVLPDGSGRLFAGSDAGLFQSTDSTHQVWTQIYDAASVYTLLLPIAATPCYAGTSHGLMASMDGCQTWRSVNTGLSLDVAVHSVARDPFDPNHLLLSTGTTLLTSSDSGTTWHLAPGRSTAQITSIIFDRMIHGRVYGLGSGNLFVTNDSGATWASLNVPGPTRDSNPGVNSILLDDQNPQTIYLGTVAGIAVSADAGATWTYRNNGLTSSISGPKTRIVAEGSNPARALYAVNAVGVYSSTNRALFWKYIEPQPRGGISEVIVVVDDKARILVEVQDTATFVITSLPNTLQSLPKSTSSPLDHKLAVPFESQWARQLPNPYTYPGNSQNGGDNCGPASISMVLQFYRIPITFPQIVAVVRAKIGPNVPTWIEKNGPGESFQLLRDNRLRLESVRNMNDVIRHIDGGHPIIMLVDNHYGTSVLYQNVAGMAVPTKDNRAFHIVVITGYETNASGVVQTVFINDPLAITGTGPFVADGREGHGKDFPLSASQFADAATAAGWSGDAVIQD